MQDILDQADLLAVRYDNVDDFGGTMVIYRHHGKMYSNSAWCHTADLDIYSPKVGRTIATMRVRVDILQDMVAELQQEVKNKQRMYNEVLGYGSKEPAEVDPTSAFKRNIEHAEGRLKKYEAALELAEASLRNYLEGQAQFAKSIRAMRAKAEDKND